MRWQSLPGAEGVRLCTRAVSPFADALIVVSEGMQRRIPGIVIPCGVPRRIQAGAPCEEIYLARALVERPVQEGVDAELQRRRTPWSWEAALASRALLGKVHHESN